MAIDITVNGAPRRLDDTSLEQAVATALAADGLDADAKGVAVAVNGEVVPRATWSARRLASGDRLEIVTVFAGG